MTQHQPVLISGAGPVGLSLALLLQYHNIDVQVYEARKEPNPQARASTFHPPVIEWFAVWGVLDEIMENAQKVTNLQYYRRENLELVADFDLGLLSNYTDYPFRLHYPQSALTRVLANQVESLGIPIFFNHRLKHFEDEGHQIVAQFESPDGEKTITGSFLCGADGAESLVRQVMGVDFEGKHGKERFLLVSTDGRLEKALHSALQNAGAVLYIFDPEEWVIVQRFPAGTRFTFRLGVGEDDGEARDYSNVHKRIDRFLPYWAHNLRGVGIYEIQQRIASSFYSGRVALVGDAAHVTSPIGGKGLNSGIMDAVLLARKLYAVAHDGADLGVLAEYDHERRAVAQAAIQAVDERAYADMTATSHHEIVQRDERFQEIALDLRRARIFLARASMLDDRL